MQVFYVDYNIAGEGRTVFYEPEDIDWSDEDPGNYGYHKSGGLYMPDRITSESAPNIWKALTDFTIQRLGTEVELWRTGREIEELEQAVGGLLYMIEGMGGRLTMINSGPAIVDSLTRDEYSGLSDVPRIGPRWRPRDIFNPKCEKGCEAIARQIQKHIGGEIITIKPRSPGAPILGRYRGKNWNWGHHDVVVKEGRVYDAFTGCLGLPINEYKALWQYQEGIKFGF